ncbi:TIGR02556 family CRISPR-associated protein [Deferribacterales bacterium Es71-Z0220]|uniref:TIGR02556 family CRISPR-associated protein n=1 Tax=Deferrivibrio essentukiensis TaxID=2880922 RepID=UPI001F601A70|nr:TIGR02556 family CRISPR-associated protein [Deferrivibrio essentukiensis]MCB4205479.1 TIGR02556 family CRISPR-associated protein [Deferrivibrio essentukiensis]
MLEAVYKLGKIIPEDDFLKEFIEEITENYKNVFKIKIDINNVKEPEYIGIDYEENDLSKKMKYFYKRGSANGPDKTPTSKVTTINKTFKNKIKNCFKKYLEENKKFLSEEEQSLIIELQKLIDKNLETIEKDLISFAQENGMLKDNDSLKEPSAITFVFCKNGLDNYIGDLELFVNVFKNNENDAYRSFYIKSNTESRAKQKYCFICSNGANEVWGFVNTFNFYTADKESYIAGGFNPVLMWKNYPVCSNCAKTLERGKKYIEENLSFKFCGFSYYLIPQLVFDDNNTLKQTVTTLKNYTNFSLQETKATLIEKTEERLLRQLSNLSNQINLNFLFYEQSNAAFKIILFLREIAPSWLKFLIDKKDIVDNKTRNFDIFKEIYAKKETINFSFSFSFLRDFFPDSKLEGKYDKHFLEILNSIFIGKNIDIDFLISRFMGKIRREFLNDLWFEPTVLKSYKILLFLDEINLLNRRKKTMKNYGNNFEEFFEENPIFDDETKKAMFLEGVLAQKLLNIQYSERNATPFRSRLNSLKIDEKIAKRLLPEIINKLEEYEKNYYRKLEETIGEYLVKSNFSHYSVDELSYYFALGMVLSKYFGTEKENKNE